MPDGLVHQASLSWLFGPIRGVRYNKVYLSVGDKEKKTLNPFLSQVEKKTKYVYEYYKSIGIPAFYELNDGNHFKDVSLRLAKAIAYLLK